jgi:predicted NAD/FAD-binding protein
MTRRDVLTAAGSALSGLTLNGQITGRKKSVIVIGAGIAGLSCAYELCMLVRF